MLEFEKYEGYNKGWWWMAQLLIAEQKCISRPKEYREYCATFVEYLDTFGAPPKPERRAGVYGTR